MPKKYNPFRPNSPVFTGMFAGRINEIERLDDILFQTKESNPSHILYEGERGIGKTSMLLVASHFAKGTLSWEEDKYDFLPIEITLHPTTLLCDLVIKMNTRLERALSQNEKALTFFKKSWSFATRIQSSVVSLRPKQTSPLSQEQLIDKTIFSIADTVKAITEDTKVSELGLRKKKDGIIILIDEADQASKSLEIGIFLKNLTEVLVQEDANKVLLILAGLPKTKDILKESHESSLRLFEKFELKTLEAIS